MKRPHSMLGARIKKIREENDLSLLAINKVGGPDPSYINRIERGRVNPRAENVAKLARAIAAAKGWSLEELWNVMDELFEAAGFAPPKRTQEPLIRRRFREILEARGLDPKQIEAAMAQVPAISMLQVIEGDDLLEIRPVEDAQKAGSQHREAFILPALSHDFRAGPRANLHVDGDLAPTKREQLKLLAKLVEKILAD